MNCSRKIIPTLPVAQRDVVAVPINAVTDKRSFSMLKVIQTCQQAGNKMQ
jgi:hypothetical protein